jgi:hypothetical protein
MTRYNYGGVNGVSSMLVGVKVLARVWLNNSNKIKAWVNSSQLTDAQKATLIQWLDGLVLVTEIIFEIETKYE